MRRLPPVLLASRRHELPPDYANRSICSVLKAVAFHNDHGDPIVKAFDNRYVMVGDLWHAYLWNHPIEDRWPLAIREGVLYDVAGVPWKPLGPALGTVEYLIPRRVGNRLPK
jgi:hypothetical protein